MIHGRLTALAVLLLAGCGGPQVESVSGHVLVNGRPLDDVEVCLWPARDLRLGMMVCRQTDSEGAFTIRPNPDRCEGFVGDYVVVLREDPVRYRHPRFPRKIYSDERNGPWRVTIGVGATTLPGHDIDFPETAE